MLFNNFTKHYQELTFNRAFYYFTAGGRTRREVNLVDTLKYVDLISDFILIDEFRYRPLLDILGLYI